MTKEQYPLAVSSKADVLSTYVTVHSETGRNVLQLMPEEASAVNWARLKAAPIAASHHGSAKGFSWVNVKNLVVPSTRPHRFYGGGPSTLLLHGCGPAMRLASVHPLVGYPTSSEYAEILAESELDADMVRAVLSNVWKTDRFEAQREVNASVPALGLLPRTTSSSTALDERQVAVLESQQQRDAILLARDFRDALETLIKEEQFSSYDLSRVIGITPGMLVTWKARPLDKLRQANQGGVGRLLFAWKYWLHVTEGDMLGRYLRHVPEGSATSLLDLLAKNEPTDEEVASLVERLARYAAEDRKAAAQRRRDVGGLPGSVLQQELRMD